MQKKRVVVNAPRSFIVFCVQYMAVVPFCTAFGFMLLPVLSKPISNSDDFITLFSLISFFMVIGFALLYFPQKQRTICIYDKNSNVLKKIKRNKIILTCNLIDTNKIILKIIKQDIGVNIKILLEKTNNNIELYCEQNYLSYKQWIVFANKLAEVTSLPLKEDSNLVQKVKFK